MSDPRKIAWEVLNKCASADQYSNLALDTAIKRAELTEADRGLLTTLVYGVIEKQIPLDACIDSMTRGKPGDILPEVRNLLRMGIYQLLYLDRIPDHAAVNEAVNAAPKRAKGFVNALLRAFVRAGKRIPVPDRESDPIGYLSVRYSFGAPLCERFVAAFGMTRTEELLAAFDRQPPLTLRVNTLRISREAFLEELKQAGIRAEACAESHSGVHVWDKLPVPALYGFDKGLFFVQDEASQLCVEALEAQKGMTVMDTCACPGSKSFGIAIEMENDGTVLSCDLHRNKLSLVQSGAERLGISILQIEECDAREPREEWKCAFDRVLCDVPCSGFGVFAKKPELRYKDPRMSDALPQIQADILQNASSYVRVGGRLVYSTCTLLPSENEENVSRFLAAHPEFRLLRQRTLYPDLDGTDGFFFAVLERVQ